MAKFYPAPGGGADVGNFEFDESTISTFDDMTVLVSGVPGHLNLSAYTGITMSYSDQDDSYGVFLRDSSDPNNKVASINDVNLAISQLVDSAPTTLDTLSELANALGQDENFATTVTNQIASKADTTYVDSELATKAPLAQQLNAQSANYTLQSSDNGGVIKASGTITITVPDAVFNAGERVDIVNTGTGVITISAGSGVTLLSKESAATIDTQYGAATVLFDSASQAFLIGDLA